MSDQNQALWIRQHLGIDPAAGGMVLPRPKLSPIWNDAKETVDAGIDRLQRALSGMQDEDLDQIVEYGLFRSDHR